VKVIIMLRKIVHTQADSALTIARVPEQSPRYNRENAMVDGTLISAPSQSTTMPSSSAGTGAKHFHFGMLYCVVPLSALALLAYLLRGVSSNILRHEFGGLAVVVCVLAYVAVFLRQVTRALAEDARHAEVMGCVESLSKLRTPSQSGRNPAPSGNPTRRYEPVEQRT
jgi:hypothetical protein